jgi:hypothetical protein
MERFNQFHKFCIDGVMEMNFSGNPQIQTVEIDMLPWKAINFPDDMVDWAMIGFRCGSEVKAFVRDELSLIRDTKDCVPQPYTDCIDKAPNSGWEVPFFLDDQYASGGNHYYGKICTGAPGYFDADEKNRIFNFAGPVNNINKVYLKYISHGINPTGKTIIHPYFFKPLQYFIHWQRKLHSGSFGEGERQAAQRLYENSFDNALVNKMDLSIDTILDILRRNYVQTPKG